jgi:hypothetical protein
LVVQLERCPHLNPLYAFLPATLPRPATLIFQPLVRASNWLPTAFQSTWVDLLHSTEWTYWYCHRLNNYGMFYDYIILSFKYYYIGPKHLIWKIYGWRIIMACQTKRGKTCIIVMNICSLQLMIDCSEKLLPPHHPRGKLG